MAVQHGRGRASVTVVGAGIVGLWQAYELARRGHRVSLREAAPEDATGAASRMAGAMLAPYCEAETAPALVTELGLRGLSRWRQLVPDLPTGGTLVVAPRRDTVELAHFARRTTGHLSIGPGDLTALEPELAGSFDRALHYRDESHVSPRLALSLLIDSLRSLGVDLGFSQPIPEPLWLAAGAGELVIDCRGISAQGNDAGLRGVAGEMAVLHAPGVRLSRPVRLLHPRVPVYIVPWGKATYMVGATMLESASAGGLSLRSALDLLGSATVVHPGFAGAHVIEMSTGIRPAYDDNLPKVVWRGRCLSVNGAYRHGFLLAPALAEIVADHLEMGSLLPPELTVLNTRR